MGEAPLFLVNSKRETVREQGDLFHGAKGDRHDAPLENEHRDHPFLLQGRPFDVSQQTCPARERRHVYRGTSLITPPLPRRTLQ